MIRLLKLCVLTLIAMASWATAAEPLKPVVEIEETVYMVACK